MLSIAYFIYFKNTNIITQMKKIIYPILFLLSNMSAAQDIKSSHISLVQSVSTDGQLSKTQNYYFSLNILAGTVSSIKGFEIGGLYNQNNGNMTGFQVSGLVNNTKGTMKGFQTSGTYNESGNVLGAQNSGLANLAQNVKGIQVAGLFNSAKEVKGAQISGIFNKATKVNGIQIGLINIADTLESGGIIGLINILKNGGYSEVELSVADYQNIGFAYKSGPRFLYTIVSMGYKFNESNSSLLISGLGLGGLIPLARKLFLKPELIWHNYFPDDFKFKRNTQTTHFKLGLMKQVGKVAFTLAPSIYYGSISRNQTDDVTKISHFKPIVQYDKGRIGYGISFGVGLVN